MKHICSIKAIFIASVILFSCKPSRELTPVDFLKIEDEVSATDLKQQSKEKAAAKYGYTLQQYEKFEERAKSDKKLQEELGKIRLEQKQTK